MDYHFKGVLYKGDSSTDAFDNTREQPTWFALQEETIDKYGKIKYKLEINKEVKLLNITTWKFRNDLFNKLNNLSLLDDALRRKKAITLMALGLPNLETQLEFMRRYLSDIPKQYKDTNILVDTCSLIGHRLSEKQIDLEMVNMLQFLYGHDYSGYIQPQRITSCWMNEFAAEVCFFNLKIIEFSSIDKLKTVQKGGSLLKNDVFYYKLNDLMCSEIEYKKLHRNTMFALLRYDEYSEKEISEIKTFPNEKERMKKIRIKRFW